MRVNVEQASKDRVVGADLSVFQGRLPLEGEEATFAPSQSHRGSDAGMSAQGNRPEHGKPQRWERVTLN